MKSGSFSHVQFAVRSEIGLRRKNNEDSHGEFPDCGVWCVADGMGGGDDGEVASAAVIQHVGDFCKSIAPGEHSGPDVAGGIVQAVNAASGWIFQRSMSKKLRACGSTFVGVVFDPADPRNAIALHAGDSRLYRVRGKGIRQITKDHSAAELIGAKNEDDINPMFRGMILRAVGVRPDVDVERTELPLCEGDVVLICSDGLSKMVADKAIAATVKRCGASVRATADALIEAAYAAGATDNVTVAVLKVGAFPKPAPVRPLNLGESVSAPKVEDGAEPVTGETCVGTEAGVESSDSWAVTSAGTLGGAEGVTMSTMDVFPVAEDGAEPEEPVARTLREKIGGRRLLVLASVGVGILTLLAAVLIWWLGGAEARRLKVGETAARTTSEAVPEQVAPAPREKPAPARTVPVEKPPAPSVEKPLPAAKAPDASNPASASAAAETRKRGEDLERTVLVAQLKARREKACGDEKKEVAAEAAFSKSVDALICAVRGQAFREFAARIEAALGRSASERIRLIGSGLAEMKADDDRAGSAACDLVMEVQKLARSAKNAHAQDKLATLLAPVVALDPAKHEAFDVCARVIAAAKREVPGN